MEPWWLLCTIIPPSTYISYCALPALRTCSVQLVGSLLLVVVAPLHRSPDSRQFIFQLLPNSEVRTHLLKIRRQYSPLRANSEFKPCPKREGMGVGKAAAVSVCPKVYCTPLMVMCDRGNGEHLLRLGGEIKQSTARLAAIQ